ncbi:putative P2X purinoceptor 7-like [Apostichopus japonicus]|uniref:Putative P2X purinoceptor 7-like n=1 Tax=Stichopus japonicus TaxID=307972 RepID=A0A2G8K894_STIJA|nr:putative P2X purinoceptor 7-like [Apostichopus japonicus]
MEASKQPEISSPEVSDDETGTASEEEGSLEYEIPNQEEIRPYQFEPEADESDSTTDSEACIFNTHINSIVFYVCIPKKHRMPLRTPRDFKNDVPIPVVCKCKCGNCAVMPSARECRCCHEASAVMEKNAEGEGNSVCITEHQGFQPVCLDPWVLQTASYQYSQHYGEMLGKEA